MSFPFSIHKIFGNSMIPVLKPGDKVVSLNWFSSVKSGDLVIAKSDEKEIIKRVQFVKENEVFLIGENKKESTDSRSFGWIEKSQLVGKVIYILKS